MGTSRETTTRPKDAFGSARRFGFVVMAVLAALCATSAGLHAQDRDRLLGELDDTDRVLERARDVVEEHGSPRAARQLRFAFELQESAKRLGVSAHSSLFDYRRAVELTRRARLLAQRAVTIASQQARLEQRARLHLERLDLALASARERVGDAASEQKLRLIDMASRRLEQAREAFHEHRFREVIHMCQETTRLLEGRGASTPGRRFERKLDNARLLLERAQAQAHSDESQAWLERAREWIERAEATWAAGQPRAAERQLRQARELLLRVMRDGEGPLDASGVDAVLEETAAVLDDVAVQVRDKQHPEAMTFVDNAYRHLARARELRLEDELHRALEEARVARNLARRAARAAGISQL